VAHDDIVSQITLKALLKISNHGQAEPNRDFLVFNKLKLTRAPKTVRNGIKSPGILTSNEVTMVLTRTALSFFGLKAMSKLRNRIVTENFFDLLT